MDSRRCSGFFSVAAGWRLLLAPPSATNLALRRCFPTRGAGSSWPLSLRSSFAAAPATTTAFAVFAATIIIPNTSFPCFRSSCCRCIASRRRPAFPGSTGAAPLGPSILECPRRRRLSSSKEARAVSAAGKLRRLLMIPAGGLRAAPARPRLRAVLARRRALVAIRLLPLRSSRRRLPSRLPSRSRRRALPSTPAPPCRFPRCEAGTRGGGPQLCPRLRRRGRGRLPRQRLLQQRQQLRRGPVQRGLVLRRVREELHGRRAPARRALRLLALPLQAVGGAGGDCGRARAGLPQQNLVASDVGGRGGAAAVEALSGER